MDVTCKYYWGHINSNTNCSFSKKCIYYRKLIVFFFSKYSASFIPIPTSETYTLFITSINVRSSCMMFCSGLQWVCPLVNMALKNGIRSANSIIFLLAHMQARDVVWYFSRSNMSLGMTHTAHRIGIKCIKLYNVVLVCFHSLAFLHYFIIIRL